MSEKKHLTTRKKLLIVGILIILIFGAVNLFWLLTVHIPYNNYASRLEIYEEGELTFYKKEIDNYVYSLKKPSYLDFGGFLSVGATEGYVVNLDDEGNIISSNGLDVSIFIWPDVWGNYEYGVFFYDEKEEIFEQVYIDEDINYIPDDPDNDEFNEYIQRLITDNYEEIKSMMTGANELWELDD